MVEGGPPRAPLHKRKKKKSEIWILTKGLQQPGEHLGEKMAGSQEEQQALWHFNLP